MQYRIKRNEIRGNQQPLITIEYFDEGLRILAAHDENTVRSKRHFYPLAGLLYMRVEE